MIRLLLALSGLPVLLPLLSGLQPVERHTRMDDAPVSLARSAETDLLKARLTALQARVSVLNAELADTLAALEP
jgi:hypothetical protein